MEETKRRLGDTEPPFVIRVFLEGYGREENGTKENSPFQGSYPGGALRSLGLTHLFPGLRGTSDAKLYPYRLRLETSA